MKKLFRNLKRYIETIESADVPFAYWVISLFGIIFLRNFLEGIIEHHSIALSPKVWESFLRYFLHYPFFYLGNIFTLIIILYVFLRQNIEKISRVVISFSWAILICPLVDFLLSGAKGYHIGYFQSLQEVVNTFVYLFYFPVSFPTVSYGIRVEVLFVILLVFFYGFIKKGFLPAVGAVICSYCSFVFLGAVPVIVISLGNMPLNAEVIRRNLLAGVGTANSIFASPDSFFFILYFVWTVIMLWVWYAVYSRDKFVALIKNIRPFRLVHYWFLVLTGMGYGYTVLRTHFAGNHTNLFALPAVLLGVFFLWESAVVFNDIFDEAADSIGNSSRPLIKKVFSRQEYMTVGIMFFILGIQAVLGVSYFSSLMFFVFWMNYFLYSSPPFRFKKIFPVNILIVTLNGLVIFLGGVSVFAGADTLYYLKKEIVLLFSLPYILGVNIITLKDIHSDAKSGVKTIPVIFGLKRAKIVMAVFCFVAFVSAGLIIRIYWLVVPGILFGAVAAFLVMRERWREAPFFINYLLYFVIVILAYWRRIR